MSSFAGNRRNEQGSALDPVPCTRQQHTQKEEKRETRRKKTFVALVLCPFLWCWRPRWRCRCFRKPFRPFSVPSYLGTRCAGWPGWQQRLRFSVATERLNCGQTTTYKPSKGERAKTEEAEQRDKPNLSRGSTRETTASANNPKQHMLCLHHAPQRAPLRGRGYDKREKLEV